MRPGIKLTTTPNLVVRACPISRANLPTWPGIEAVRLGLMLQQLPTVQGELVRFPMAVPRLGWTLNRSQLARAVRLTRFAHYMRAAFSRPTVVRVLGAKLVSPL